ncbi:MAG: RNA methyltransferase [Bacteroidia bacterium]|nr:RNA methyltransferase [Bacteroidia bacterium]
MVLRKHITLPEIPENIINDLKLLKWLQSFLTENKKGLFEKVLLTRTRHIVCVMENVIDEHNTNAVIRSCECSGLQDVYIISGGKGFKPAKGILRGSGKWSTILRYHQASGKSAVQCMEDLKSKGYRIVVTSPHGNATPLHELDISQPLAVCFGHEQTGISDMLEQSAGEKLKIPMFGFTESFNVSVAAGIILYHLTSRLHSAPVNWQLSEKEKNNLRFEWTWKCLNRPELLVEEYYNRSDT